MFKTMKSGPIGPHLDNQKRTHLRVFLLSLEHDMFRKIADTFYSIPSQKRGEG
jgi:hypothetical protein